MKKYKFNIEFMRAFAILLVVLMHIPININSTTGLIHEVNIMTLILIQNGTVVFLFISGYLFYMLNKNLNYREYLSKKFKYVISPFVIMVLFLFLLEVFKSYQHLPDYLAFLSSNPLLLLGVTFVVPSWLATPLWFIPVMSIYYILAPIARWIFQQDKYDIFITVFFLIVTAFTARPENNANPILSFIHFTGVYLFGCLACKYEDTITSPKATLFAFVVFLVTLYKGYSDYHLHATFSFEYLIANHILTPNWNVIQKISLCIIVFSVSKTFYTRSNKFIKMMADYSFGIFFIHILILKVFGKVMVLLFSSPLTSHVFTLISGVIVLLATFCCVYLMKKVLRGKSKLIIGC